jgi:hypothetical protein
MENNYKKLLCALSVITIVVIIIQLNIAFGSNLEGNNNTRLQDNMDTPLKIDTENITSSINIKNNDQVTVK